MGNRLLLLLDTPQRRKRKYQRHPGWTAFGLFWLALLVVSAVMQLGQLVGHLLGF